MDLIFIYCTVVSTLYLHYCSFLGYFAVRIGIIYLIAGFGGSVLSSLFIRNSISVGASGALFGLLGAMLSELFTNWTIYTNKVIYSFFLILIYFSSVTLLSWLMCLIILIDLL